ncbi:MAG: hypothetical protein WC655_23945 [Candidatus Hydrogenedentales bacterium]|jgi:hypothetical protein
MKALLKQVALLFAGVAAVHIILVALTSIAYSPLDELDTFKAWETIYRLPERLVAFGVSEPALRQERNMIVLGASNAVQGFRPAELGAGFPEYRIHNMALNGSNVTEMRMAVELAIASTPPALVTDTVFVYGVWYGGFVDNSQRKAMQHAFQLDRGKEGNEDAGLRPELERWGAPGVLSNTNLLEDYPPLLRGISLGLRPYFALDRVKVFVWRFGVPLALLSGGPVGEARARAMALDLDVTPLQFAFSREAQINFWRRYMGRPDGQLKEEQFEELTALARRVEQLGACLVLVDMPIPAWHEEISKEDASYRRLMTKGLAEIATLRRISYVSLRDARLEFSDSAHPREGTTSQWSDELVKRVRPLLQESLAKPQ